MLPGLRTRLAIATLAMAGSAWPQAPAPWQARPEAAPAAPERTARSVLFDPRGAAEARARQQPQYVESLVVEGRDPDLRRAQPKPLEQRFAEALLAPRPSLAGGGQLFGNMPCMSLPSTWNELGDAHVPLSGCPQ
jgi:hypothetical protein